MKSDSPVLKLKGVDIGYSDPERVSVLTDINISFEKGEMVCLMGPNGIGKSTLLRSISGLQPFHSGSILIDSKPLESFKKQELAKHISVVLTVIPFIGNLTVNQIVSMGRYPFSNWFNRLNEQDYDVINNAIEVTNLQPIANKFFSTLSDGQKQKTLIARAIAQNGDIIILDEPTSHLDLNNRVEIMNLLRILAHNEGKCIIVSTHEMDLALQITDRLVLITSEGSIESGIPEDLVLSGKIDHTFNLKGYDLKRGKVTGRTFNHSVTLQGEDYPYLWTKNALERSGYKIDGSNRVKVKVISLENQETDLLWSVELEGERSTFHSINEMLEYLRVQTTQ